MSEVEMIRQWTYDGRECKVVQTPMGHFCGYAKTPLEFGYNVLLEGYDSGVYELVDVHGGVTYGVDEDGWIGFDCGHAGDVCVMDEAEKDEFDARTLWTPEDVADEVEKLADQISLLESFVQEVAGRVEQ